MSTAAMFNTDQAAAMVVGEGEDAFAGSGSGGTMVVDAEKLSKEQLKCKMRQ
jgi:hypothetical protein